MMIKETRTITVVYITDDGFSMPTTVSIASLIKNSGNDYKLRIYVFCDNLSTEKKDKIRKLSSNNKEIILADVGTGKYGYLSDREKLCIQHVSYTAAFKFDLPQILSEEKIIYIDGDTIIQGDISELWDLTYDDYGIYAVDDQLDTLTDGYSELSSGIAIKSPHYYNSGVMVMNLDKMRRDHRTEELVEYRINGKNRYMDQDAFNAVMHEDIKPIGFRYNFLIQVTDFYDIDELNAKFSCNETTVEGIVDKALILHFAGPIKPWVYNRPWFTDIFYRYYNMTDYKTDDLKLLSPLKRLNDDKKWLKEQVKNHKKIEWVFPYDKIKKGSKIVVWGAGNVGKSYVKQISYTEFCNIVAWVDRNCDSEEVDSPDILATVDFDYVIIATINPAFANDIKYRLINEFECDERKIIMSI